MLLRQAIEAQIVTNKRDTVSSKLEGKDQPPLMVVLWSPLHAPWHVHACTHIYRKCTLILLWEWPSFNFVSRFGIYTKHLEEKKTLNSWAPLLSLTPLDLRLKASHEYFLPDADAAQTWLFPGPDLEEGRWASIPCSYKTSSVEMGSNCIHLKAVK